MPLLALKKFNIFNIVFQYQDQKRNRPDKGLAERLHGDSLVIRAIKKFLKSFNTDQDQNPVLTEADRKQLIAIIRSYSYRLDPKGISYATCVTIVNGLIDFVPQTNGPTDSAYQYMMKLPTAELTLIPLATLAKQAGKSSTDANADQTPSITHAAITDLLKSYHLIKTNEKEQAEGIDALFVRNSWVIQAIEKALDGFKLSAEQTLNSEQKKMLMSTIRRFNWRLDANGTSYNTCVDLVNALVGYTPIDDQAKDSHYKKIMALSTQALTHYSLNDLASIIPKEEENPSVEPTLLDVTPLSLTNRFASYKGPIAAQAPQKRFKLFTPADDQVVTELKALLEPLKANNTLLTDLDKRAIISCIHRYRGRLTDCTHTLAVEIVNIILGFKPSDNTSKNGCYKQIMALSTTELAERRVIDLAILYASPTVSKAVIPPSDLVEIPLTATDPVIPKNNALVQVNILPATGNNNNA